MADGSVDGQVNSRAAGSTASAAGAADGDASMKNLLGGKGANLAEMSSLGLPVPPGFTVTTEACVHFYANGKQYPAALKAQVEAGLKTVETQTGKAFGDAANPAARVGAFGRPRLHARHDGYGAEPRAER